MKASSVCDQISWWVTIRLRCRRVSRKPLSKVLTGILLGVHLLESVHVYFSHNVKTGRESNVSILTVSHCCSFSVVIPVTVDEINRYPEEIFDKQSKGTSSQGKGKPMKSFQETWILWILPIFQNFHLSRISRAGKSKGWWKVRGRKIDSHLTTYFSSRCLCICQEN